MHYNNIKNNYDILFLYFYIYYLIINFFDIVYNLSKFFHLLINLCLYSKEIISNLILKNKLYY